MTVMLEQDGERQTYHTAETDRQTAGTKNEREMGGGGGGETETDRQTDRQRGTKNERERGERERENPFSSGQRKTQRRVDSDVLNSDQISQGPDCQPETQ